MLTRTSVAARRVSRALAVTTAATGAWRAAARLLGRSSQRATAPGSVPSTGLAHLTHRELMRAWSHTSDELRTVIEPERRMTLLITRQHLLDEMCARGARSTDGRNGLFGVNNRRDEQGVALADVLRLDEH